MRLQRSPVNIPALPSLHMSFSESNQESETGRGSHTSPPWSTQQPCRGSRSQQPGQWSQGQQPRSGVPGSAAQVGGPRVSSPVGGPRVSSPGRSGSPGVTHLACAVAALPGQVLPVHQCACGPAALQGEPGVDERGGPGVVVDKERLGDKPRSGQCSHTLPS